MSEELTEIQIRDLVVKKVETRWRLQSATDNILDTEIHQEDLWAAIYDAVDDINAEPPQTQMTLVSIYTALDTRWRRLLYYGTAVNIIKLLLAHWTAEGFDAQLGDIPAVNRRGDYESLLNTLSDDFDTKLEKLKKTSQKFVLGFTSRGNASPLRTVGSYSSSANKCGRW